MPPAAPRSRTPKLNAGVGVMSLASRTGNTSGGDDLGAGLRKCLRFEARVVADAEPLGGVFFGMDVRGNRLGGHAYIGKRKVIGNDAAPSVSAKLDYRMRHDQVRFLPLH